MLHKPSKTECESNITKRIVDILFHAGEANTFVHPQINNYCTALKDSYEVRVRTVSGRNYFLQGDGYVVFGYERSPLAKGDGISTKLVYDMLREKVDLVIVHGLMHLITLSALIIFGARRKKIVIVNTGLYGISSQRNLALRIRNLLIGKLIIRTSSLVINQSRSDEVVMASWLKISPVKNILFPIWESSEREKLAGSALSFKESDYFTVLYVGRLDPLKHVEDLISAFSELHKKAKRSRLHIVGDGPVGADLKTLVRDLGIEEFVKFFGWVSHNDVWKYYVSSDIFVLPSETESTCPRSVLEAMMTATPVIARAIPQVLEKIIDGYNGLTYRGRIRLVDLLTFAEQNREAVKMIGQIGRDTLHNDEKLASTKFLGIIKSELQTKRS